MSRSPVPVVGAAIIGMAVLSLGAFSGCAWLITTPAGRVSLWPAAGAGAVAVVWLFALVWVCSRMADYIDWCRWRREQGAAAAAREHIDRALGREPTVEIDGLRVRSRVMRLMMPHTHWMKILERAREQDADASR